MKLIETKHALRAELAPLRAAGRTIGFVPTMGFFHQGHLALIRRAKEADDLVVVSVFVNPLQFGPSEDFSRYPRDLDRDLALAGQAGADYLLAPSEEEMYPGGETSTRVEVGPMGEVGEGRHRPGHFAGVATVCLKLFHLVEPDRAYFGRKDAQQLAVIRKMVRDLDLDLEVVACPTVREPDGLAASSRNHYLDGASRRAAAVLPRALFAASEAARSGRRSAGEMKGIVEGIVSAEPGVRLQYVEVFDPETFQPLAEVRAGATIALAAYAGGARLIDAVEIS
ncbi:MAG: pantoate--beta-alanine ligase [Actinomycetota bacterium]